MAPIELKGKTVKDAYEDRSQLIIEFTDGTKICMPIEFIHTKYKNQISVREPFIRTTL